MSNERSHAIVKEAMKPHVPKAQLSMATLQLLLPIGTQRE